MHDSLDLTELKEEARLFRKRTGWYKHFRKVFLTVIGLTFVLTLLPADQNATDTLVPIIKWIVYTGLTIVWIGVSLLIIREFIYSTRRSFQRIAHINQYAPDFVPRLGKWSVFRSPFGLVTILLVIVGVILFPDRAFHFYVIYLFAIFFVFFLYTRAVLRWWDSPTDWIQQLIARLPKGVNLLASRAVHLLNQGELEEAAEIFKQILASRSRLLGVYGGILLNNLGYCLTLNQRYDEALPLLEAAIRIDPGYPLAYDSLAEWYLAQNLDAERAVELCEVAVEIAPQFTKDTKCIERATYARALALTGRTARAEAALKLATESTEKLKPTTIAEVNRQAGYAQFALGNAQAARQHFTHALEVSPGSLYAKLAQQALDTLFPTPIA
ncbi:MAG: tetratricopeptide repeat protein [Anaerolineae bacterium]